MNVSDAIASWEQMPFVRGRTDCCAFVDHCLVMMTGVSYLPRYTDDQSAFDILGEHGGMEGAVTHYFGKAMVDVDELKAGDVVLIRFRNNEAIGLLMENGNVAVVFENVGLVEMRPGFVDGGWPVGD